MICKDCTQPLWSGSILPTFCYLSTPGIDSNPDYSETATLNNFQSSATQSVSHLFGAPRSWRPGDPSGPDCVSLDLESLLERHQTTNIHYSSQSALCSAAVTAATWQWCCAGWYVRARRPVWWKGLSFVVMCLSNIFNLCLIWRRVPFIWSHIHGHDSQDMTQWWPILCQCASVFPSHPTPVPRLLYWRLCHVEILHRRWAMWFQAVGDPCLTPKSSEEAARYSWWQDGLVQS